MVPHDVDEPVCAHRLQSRQLPAHLANVVRAKSEAQSCFLRGPKADRSLQSPLGTMMCGRNLRQAFIASSNATLSWFGT